jgi:hypothetical protein
MLAHLSWVAVQAEKIFNTVRQGQNRYIRNQKTSFSWESPNPLPEDEPFIYNFRYGTLW